MFGELGVHLGEIGGYEVRVRLQRGPGWEGGCEVSAKGAEGSVEGEEALADGFEAANLVGGEIGHGLGGLVVTDS